ncbi:hypothetical protein AHF37_03470 [Paragonimus kellicotti]|nr:hypothetical protein AHF37_03470 [Paragonimus kellicotti]
MSYFHLYLCPSFAAPDSITNIIFDSDIPDSSVEIPVIRAATVLKLIERMTYHAYFDSKTVGVFLMVSVDSISHVHVVLNFLIKWVKDPSFYKLDILPNQALRERLWKFLDSVDARNLANNVANIRKSLRGDRIRLRQTIEQLPPEPLDLGLVTCPEDVKLANVHPLELARQITLHEWELYSRIEFWEVNGQEKVKGPNLQASLDFSNKTYRRYIQPLTLLELLIDRFNVPEPDFAEAAEQASVAAGEIDSPITVAVRLEKRFRSMYKRRVQYRVLNFLIKWVKDPSFYKLDILPNQALRERLWKFLDSVDARNLANNVANIRKSLRGDRIRLRQTIEQLPPEPLDLGLVTCPEDVKLANVRDSFYVFFHLTFCSPFHFTLAVDWCVYGL